MLRGQYIDAMLREKNKTGREIILILSLLLHRFIQGDSR